MRRRTGWTFRFALIAMTAAACGDDPAGPGDTVLEEQEAVELANAMLAASSALAAEGAAPQGDELAPSATSTPRVVHTLEGSWTRTAPCPVGGEVDVQGSIDGTFDDETQELIVGVTASLTHDDCAFNAQGKVFTTNGDPHLDFSADLHHVAGEPEGEQTLALSGSFTWEDDEGRSDACDVDLNASLDPETNTRTLSGTFCGHTIDATVTIGAD